VSASVGPCAQKQSRKSSLQHPLQWPFNISLVYWLWSAILQKTELNRANAFSFLVPIFGLSLGALFFNERVGWIEVIGIGLTLVGIALASRSKNRPALLQNLKNPDLPRSSPLQEIRSTVK